MPQNNSQSEELYQAILSLKTEAELQRFFRDLLTEKEIAEFSNRWQAARLLNDRISYAAIVKETGLSSTTVARIAKWLKGEIGGYRLAIARRAHHHIMPRPR